MTTVSAVGQGGKKPRRQKRDPIIRTLRVMVALRARRRTTAEIAEMNQMTRFGAWDLMTVIASSHDVAVTQDDEGYWYIVGVTPTRYR